MKLFRSSAISDASRFLEWAQKHDERSALRLYNSARIDILSNIPDQIKCGINTLSEIAPPDDQCEAPDICWHKDNWTSFENDLILRDIIQRDAAHAYTMIRTLLERNYSKAILLEEARGDIWRTEYKQNKAAIASFGVVMLALGRLRLRSPGCDY